MRNVLIEHIKYSRQIFLLARVDLIKVHRGSVLGALWVFIQPAMQISVFWFMIHIGMRASTSKDGVPFLMWLIVGMVPWFFMSDMIGRGMDSFKSYKYLVTKVKFPISVIPTFVCISNLIVHLTLLAATIIYVLTSGITLHWTMLQLPLYTVLMFLFFQAWSLFAAPLALLSKDFSLGIKALSRMLLFISGIIWDVSQVNVGWIRNSMAFNPISFFVEGYRNSLLYGVWVWEQPAHLAIFLGELIIFAGAALLMLRHTRPNLGDVL